MSRGTEVRNRIRPAMLALRDAEDWARLELRDEVLATRLREIHESLTEDVLNGRSDRETAHWKARLWDRYAMWRGHSANEGAARRCRRLRQMGAFFCRREFEMSDEQLGRLLEASRPQPYLLGSGGVRLTSDAWENANEVWRALGAELGFDWLTVEPVRDKGQRFFTAVAT